MSFLFLTEFFGLKFTPVYQALKLSYPALSWLHLHRNIHAAADFIEVTQFFENLNLNVNR